MVCECRIYVAFVCWNNLDQGLVQQYKMVFKRKVEKSMCEFKEETNLSLWILLWLLLGTMLKMEKNNAAQWTFSGFSILPTFLSEQMCAVCYLGENSGEKSKTYTCKTNWFPVIWVQCCEGSAKQSIVTPISFLCKLSGEVRTMRQNKSWAILSYLCTDALLRVE